ncbi:MAG: hypothetical protein ACRDSJ_08405 [Rubrobacteraceae bacterium]
MRRKLVEDETGVALGLAIMVVVVVGVMGAGLLVFARNDLESVIRANQGQRAFYAADAGIQAAKRQLLGDTLPESYDDDDANDACDSPADEDAPVSSEWTGSGAEREFAEDDFTAAIRWLGDGCGFPTGGDPDSEYFEIVSTGTSGDARRRIEATYVASDVGAPLANHAAENVVIGGTAEIVGVSVFSGADVEIANSDSLQGSDDIYPDWATESSAAGVGAVGDISGDRSEVGTRDFDGNEGFVAEDPVEGEISFPFDPNHFPSALNFLKEEADEIHSGGGFSWPANSSNSTVVYVEFDGSVGTVNWTPGICDDPSECRGTLVVENGDFVMRSGSAFGGAVVVAGGENQESLSVNVEEGALLEGFASSSGEINLNGEIQAPAREEAMLRPGFHGTELWSWRELYE